MTHRHTHKSYTLVCVYVSVYQCPLPSALSCPVLLEAERGMDVLSSPCLSSSHLRSCRLVRHANVSFPALPSSFFRFLSPSLSVLLQFALSIASLILSVSICSLLLILISQVVFQPPRVSLLREESSAPSLFSLSCSCYLPLSQKLNS